MYGITTDLLIQILLFLIILAISGYILTKVIKSIIISYQNSKKQAIGVIARYRNKATEALWKDLMDIKIAGIIPVGTKIEDWLNAMFPREMEELERQRKSNPVAWRSTMEFLMPLVVSLKHFAAYKGQDILKGIMANVGEALNDQSIGAPEGNKGDPNSQVQGVFQDLNKGEPGGRQ